MPKLSLRFLIPIVLLVVFVAGPSLIRFYTEWLWFGEVGYRRVYSTILGAQATLFVIAFAAAFVWLAVNLHVAMGSMRDVRPVFTTRDGIEVSLPGRQQLRTLALGIAMVISILIGLYAAARWEVWMAWRYAVPFGQTDPVIGYDVGFYVFSLPFLQFVRGIAQGLVVLAALASAGVYLMTGSLTSGFPASLSMTRSARRHLSLLAAAFLIALGIGAWLQRAEYLVEPSALFHGASYTDVHARMPLSLVLVGVCVVGVLLAFVHAQTRRNWPLPVAAVLYLLVAIGGEGYSTILQRFVVSPNEQVRETPFIGHNIQATRRAFGLDQVEEREISGDTLLTREDIARNATTLQNVRLWDHQPLLDTFKAIQVIRTYYDFVTVDNDRYPINGTLRQVMLSARELDSSALQNPTWINQHLTYTHGYGLTLGPVNQVTSEGLPVLFVRNLPPETTVGLTVTEPSLYFGELSNDYIIVRTKHNEFHYPRGDEDVPTKYSGSGGVALDSIWRKLLFAFRFGSYQIVLSDDIVPESRIVYNRRISDRVRALAPFLTFDLDPYLVVSDGKLFWIYDAYTSSSLYPYSAPVRLPAGQANYMRNAVKFVIDAYNGTTTAYLSDETDPIVRTYARIFPALFKPIGEMPPGLRAHIRYPEDIFAIQSSVYATYHMTQPAVYYNREDQWEIPVVGDQGDMARMQPYYTVMRLPGERDAEFIQMLPFTPRRRDNLSAWLVARSDGENYGRLRVFEFPKQKLVFGPRQVVARINQDQTISPQITLWNQQGSQVIWGTLMVIPIEESIVYVRPLYLRGAGGRIPELRRVVVAHQDQIVMERTLEEAVARLFGGDGKAPAAAPELQTRAPEAAPATGPGVAPPGAAAQLSQLATEARAHYDRAVEAQRAGDWAKYGEELRLLSQTLDKLKGASGGR